MTIIIRQNGTRYDLKEFGIRTKDFVVSSPSPRHTTEEIDGRHGVVDTGTTYDVRTITCSFRMSAYDLSDYPLMRDEVFALFQSTEAFYLIDSRIPFKRWFVKVASSFDPSQAYTFGDFTVQFVSFFPFAESIGTTQDIQVNGINADDELWGFGMGLIAEDEALKYTHTGTSFRIYNAGNVPIHPFQQDLKITIKQVLGSTGYFELRNLTNGTGFRVNEAVSDTQTIVLDGPNITSNGLNFLRKTNKGFIELSPGWNDFQLYGASRATIEFDFRFYYL